MLYEITLLVMKTKTKKRTATTATEETSGACVFMCAFKFVWYVNYYDGNHNVVADVIFHNFTISTNQINDNKQEKQILHSMVEKLQRKNDENINMYISQ